MTVFFESHRLLGIYKCQKSKKVDDLKNLLACSVCRSVSYCTAACQKADWCLHKAGCQLIAKRSRNEKRMPITAENIKPLCEGACGDFQSLKDQRGLSCHANLVYVVSSGSTYYRTFANLYLRHIHDGVPEEKLASMATGFSARLLRRRGRDILAYLHVAEEIYKLNFIHPDVKNAIRSIFALGVPNTRVLLFFHRTDNKVSVSAGTKPLPCSVCEFQANE